MRYKITQGMEYIKDIFEELKNDPRVTNSYFGETILTLGNGNFALAYEPNKNEITIMGKENSDLLKKFNESINKKEISLEEIK